MEEIIKKNLMKFLEQHHLLSDAQHGFRSAVTYWRWESWRLKRAYKRQLDKLTNERAEGRLEVPVAVTGRSTRELSIEERSTIDDWRSQPTKAQTEDWKV
nr:unnamed protein product [Spirometra erinaceieuropaei]